MKASANLNHLYIAAARNRLWAAQGRAAANAQAALVKALFERDAELTRQHDAINGGKWVHMMDQTHIGYTTWQQPETNVMPKVETVTPAAGLGVALEGGGPALPPLRRWGAASRWIDVFNRGATPIDVTARADAPWLKVSKGPANALGDVRIELAVDWSKAPKGEGATTLTIAAGGETQAIPVSVSNPQRRPAKGAFVEAGGLVAIEAQHHAAATGAQGVSWKTIPNLGRTLSGVASYPSTAPSSKPGPGAPVLDYLVDFEAAGRVDLTVLVAPTLDFRGGPGLTYAVSIDEAAPVIVNSQPDRSERAWDKAVADNIRAQTTRLDVPSAGPHRVRLWRVDPGVVFQRLVLSRGAVPESYLGPPESVRAPLK